MSSEAIPVCHFLIYIVYFNPHLTLQKKGKNASLKQSTRALANLVVPGRIEKTFSFGNLPTRCFVCSEFQTVPSFKINNESVPTLGSTESSIRHRHLLLQNQIHCYRSNHFHPLVRHGRCLMNAT